jgi:AraC-like DNA-binding protein
MPGMSLNEIAFSLGFIDQSSFNRAFKRWTGGSPGQYRRERKAR